MTFATVNRFFYKFALFHIAFQDLKIYIILIKIYKIKPPVLLFAITPVTVIANKRTG